MKHSGIGLGQVGATGPRTWPRQALECCPHGTLVLWPHRAARGQERSWKGLAPAWHWGTSRFVQKGRDLSCHRDPQCNAATKRHVAQ